ncbi:unnamed protein product [Scytosiphon promiscuus]
MEGEEWPSFPPYLLDAPAEDWGSLPAGTSWSDTEGTSSYRSDGNNPAVAEGGGGGGAEEDADGDEALLARLEEAFAVDRGGDQDHAQALDTIQTFLSTRRVRLLEDLLVLSSSLGGVKASGDHMPPTTTAATARARAGGSLPLSVAGLRRELALARDTTTNAFTATVAPSPAAAGVVRWSEGGVAAEALRTAAGSSTEVFFSTWAERFGTLLVPLGGGTGDEGGDGGEGGGDGGGGGGGGARKDDREIQAARDVERDMLSVNGVLVKGSEGYPVVIGKVKRELARLTEPVAGADAVADARRERGGEGGRGGERGGQGGSEESRGSGSSGGGRGSEQVRRPSRQGESSILPLRPPRQLQNFSKLILKAANRTESGGLSFDAINRILELCPDACDGSVLVVPDSSKAEPLGISITAGRFTEKGDTPFGPLERVGVPELLDGLHAFGICAHIEAVTVYSLYSADMERVHLRLRATFRNSLRLPISPFSGATCQSFSDVGYRGENGDVEIEVLEGAHRSQH